MMNDQDRAAIEGLFERMAEFGRQGTPRDGDAERLIAEHLRAQPGAAYYMAQTIIVQEQALKAAQDRLEQAERSAAREPEPKSGGFLSSVWGGGRGSDEAPSRRGSVPSFGRRDERDGYGQQPGYGQQGQQGGFGQQGGMMQGRGGGGFLAGAAQTAMGVAGGVMLGNMIGGMFGGGASPAAAAATPAAAADTGGDAGAENVADTGADNEGGGGMFDQLFGGDDGGGDDGGGFDEA